MGRDSLKIKIKFKNIGFHSNICRTFAKVWFYYVVLLYGMNRSVWHPELCFVFLWVLAHRGNMNNNQHDVRMKAEVFSGNLCRRFNFSLPWKFYSSDVFVGWMSIGKIASAFSFLLLQNFYEKIRNKTCNTN